jgi:hypothetical protein
MFVLVPSVINYISTSPVNFFFEALSYPSPKFSLQVDVPNDLHWKYISNTWAAPICFYVCSIYGFVMSNFMDRFEKAHARPDRRAPQSHNLLIPFFFFCVLLWRINQHYEFVDDIVVVWVHILYVVVMHFICSFFNTLCAISSHTWFV